MCFLPYMTPVQQTTMAIDAFGGYDHNLRIADGSLYDMKNLTSDNFPVLTPRKRRGRYLTPASGSSVPADAPIDGIAYSGSLCCTQCGNLYIGDRVIDVTEDLVWPMLPAGRNLIVNGSYILFMNEKKYFNTLDEEDRGDMETSYEYKRNGDGNDLGLCVFDGENVEITKIEYNSPDRITSPQEGMICFSDEEGNEFVKRYSAKTEKWVDMGEASFWFETQEGQEKLFFDQIADGDSITIDEAEYYDERGGSNQENYIWEGETYATVFEFQGEKRFRITNPRSILDLIAWQWSVSQMEEGGYIRRFSLGRYVPRMDFVIECNNRLWGCRYGKNRSKEFVNELYAAQQGAFKNWNTFAGVSTDSYVASCGAAGPFTAAVNFNGRPLFFKENHYYLVSGDYPAEYGYSDSPISGVQEGSGKSLVVIDRVAYYKGVDGVYAFDGYSATCISAALGDKKYTEAVAGGYGKKYYISMFGEDEQWHLFVYDIQRGLWHHEDNLQIVQFCAVGNDLYMLDADGVVHTVNGSGELDEAPVEWMAETGNLTTGIPYKKYLAKLNVRMKVHQGASVRIFIQYDESGKWEELFYMTATKQRSFTIPIRPKRCDHIKLKLTGVGDVELYSIIKTLEKGSDL